MSLRFNAVALPIGTGLPRQTLGLRSTETHESPADAAAADVGALQRLMREVVQRLRHEKLQRAAGERTRLRLIAALEQMPQLVAIADADGSLVYLNRAGRELTGTVCDADLFRLSLSHCIGLEPGDPLVCDWLAAALRDGACKREATLIDRCGAELRVSATLAVHRGATGEVEGFSTVVHDISERARVENALRRSREELRRLSAAQLNMQEDERKRIASDLHDGVGQQLSLIKLSIEEVARQIAAGTSADAPAALRRLGGSVADVLTEVRHISLALRPPMLDDLGILATLSWYLRELSSACRHVAIRRTIGVTEDQVPEALKLAIYRIVQEATHNVLKHAQASSMCVSLVLVDGALQLCIEDDGCGFDPQHLRDFAGEPKGLGLLSMKERAALSEGTYHLESAAGRGTRVRVDWSTRLQ